MIDLVKPLVPRINTRTLIIQGQLDTVVEPTAASWLHENLASTDKTIIGLAGTDHLVALDCEREQVITVAKAFVLTTAAAIGAHSTSSGLAFGRELQNAAIEMPPSLPD